MYYLSIDIETTGLNPQTCDIIEFAAVLDDLSNPQPVDSLPCFHAYIKQECFNGEPYALSMHSKTFEKIAYAQKNNIETFDTGEKFIDILSLPIYLKNFLTRNHVSESSRSGDVKISVAGKNFAMFDFPFIKEKMKPLEKINFLTEESKAWKNIKFLHRVLDPAILYYEKGDSCLPDSKTCMQRAGLKGDVSHTALEDAKMVVRLIRKKLINL